MSELLASLYGKKGASLFERGLDAALPYFKPSDFIIVGNAAIRLHAMRAGHAYPSRPFNDLDFCRTEKLLTR